AAGSAATCPSFHPGRLTPSGGGPKERDVRGLAPARLDQTRRTLTALGPRSLDSDSNSTLVPSARVDPSVMPLWCTKRSLPPSSAVMKPYRFSSLNHFTVPVAMCWVLLRLYWGGQITRPGRGTLVGDARRCARDSR